MTKPTGKKRGRPRKMPDFMIHLAEDQEKWNKWLSSMGFPEHSSSTKEILEHRLPDIVNEDGESARPRIGNRLGDRSLTQPSDSWYALLLNDDAGVPLPAPWLRYLEYVNVVAEYLSPKDKGAAIKKLALEDARSRFRSRPPQFPAELGTPAEFKARLAGHELEIRLRADRRNHVISIRVYQLPPDEQEDLDPSDDPAGHWEGLTWFPEIPLK
jgi:hypothetical protein